MAHDRGGRATRLEVSKSIDVMQTSRSFRLIRNEGGFWCR